MAVKHCATSGIDTYLNVCIYNDEVCVKGWSAWTTDVRPLTLPHPTAPVGAWPSGG